MQNNFRCSKINTRNNRDKNQINHLEEWYFNIIKGNFTIYKDKLHMLLCLNLFLIIYFKCNKLRKLTIDNHSWTEQNSEVSNLSFKKP